MEEQSKDNPGKPHDNDEKCSEKKPYIAPTLYEYGEIKRYTGSGSGMNSENTGMMTPDRRI